MDMELFDALPSNPKAIKGQRNHRSKDHDRNSDDFKSLRKANRRDKPRERYFEEEEE